VVVEINVEVLLVRRKLMKLRISVIRAAATIAGSVQGWPQQRPQQRPQLFLATTKAGCNQGLHQHKLVTRCWGMMVG